MKTTNKQLSIGQKVTLNKAHKIFVAQLSLQSKKSIPPDITELIFPIGTQFVISDILTSTIVLIRNYKHTENGKSFFIPDVEIDEFLLT